MSASIGPASDIFLDAPRVPISKSGVAAADTPLAVRELFEATVGGLQGRAAPGGSEAVPAVSRPALRYHHDSDFVSDFDLRVPLTRAQWKMIKAGLERDRARGKEGLTKATAAVGLVMLEMIGRDGRLDPTLATLAERTGYRECTVKRAINQLKRFGYLEWTRRIVRNRLTGAVRQTSNAYVLRVPAAKTPGTHFAHESLLKLKKLKTLNKVRRVGERLEVEKEDAFATWNAARQAGDADSQACPAPKESLEAIIKRRLARRTAEWEARQAAREAKGQFAAR